MKRSPVELDLTLAEERRLGLDGGYFIKERQVQMAFTLQLGAAAPDFDLPGTDGKRYSLSSFKDAKVLVVLFTCNHCPYVIGSEDRMIRFHADYLPRGVQMVAINSNETEGHPTDSFDH